MQDAIINQNELCITNEMRDAIENRFKQIEEELNINIFFACDTGSRALGVPAETSDFDVNGFFIPNYKEYFKIIRKSDLIITRQGGKIDIGDKVFDIDLVLWDIKEWLKEKVEKNVLGGDFMFESPIVYRNLHPEIIKEIQKYISVPFYYFWGKMKNTSEDCHKALAKGGCQHKRIMNFLIYCTQYLHTRVFDDFPCFNIFLEMEKFTANKDKIIGDGQKQLTESEYDLLQQCFDLINISYESKKKGKKSLAESMPDFVTDFEKLLNNKFNARTKKGLLENLFNENNVQGIFDMLLQIYKK